MDEKLRKRLKEVPARPGVYLFRDAAGGIIYIGKAVSLKARVGSYFHKTHRDEKTEALVANIRDLDYILTGGEVEALLLECTLIKKHRPHFNIRLKDDSGYPFLKLTDEKYPRLVFTRRREGGGTWFGPYSSARDVRGTMRFLQRVFPLRLCAEIKKQPCMYYHIGKCDGPCSDTFDPERYSRNVHAVRMFLRGRNSAVVKLLREEMAEAARLTQFERAAVLRDRLAAVENLIGERRQVVLAGGGDFDAVGLAVGSDLACAALLPVREGAVAGQKTFFLDVSGGGSDLETLDAFLELNYTQTDDFPAEILVPERPSNAKLIEEIGRERAGRRVSIVSPKRGAKRDLVEMAAENAAHRLEVESKRREESREKIDSLLHALASRLGEESPPALIAGMDISTIQRTNTVGSVVTFKNGEPWKAGYRKFIIRGRADDIAAMREMSERYFTRVRDREEPPPDLVIVDGGQGQLGAVEQGLAASGLEAPPEVISFAKESFLSHRIGEDEPLELARDEAAAHMIQRVIAEAHRFAITFHRKRRGKKAFD